MPGRRNFARERLRHSAQAPAKQADLYWLLRQQLPDRDHALVGYPAIIARLHSFGIRRLNGGPLTERIVRSWRSCGFPVVNGRWRSCGKVACLTTTHALTAWMLTRPVDTGDLFRVDMTQALPTTGSFHASGGTRQRSAA